MTRRVPLASVARVIRIHHRPTSTYRSGFGPLRSSPSTGLVCHWQSPLTAIGDTQPSDRVEGVSEIALFHAIFHIFQILPTFRWKLAATLARLT